jgi:SnoaL-like domain
VSDQLADADGVLRHLANRYADAINRAAFDEVAQCWAPTGEWRTTTPFNISRTGREDIVARLVEGRADTLCVVMMVGSTVALEATRDRIIGRTTIEEIGSRDAERGLHVFGMYDDELVCIDGQWHFQRRTLNVLAYDPSPRNLRPVA